MSTYAFMWSFSAKNLMVCFLMFQMGTVVNKKTPQTIGNWKSNLGTYQAFAKFLPKLRPRNVISRNEINLPQVHLTLKRCVYGISRMLWDKIKGKGGREIAFVCYKFICCLKQNRPLKVNCNLEAQCETVMK